MTTDDDSMVYDSYVHECLHSYLDVSLHLLICIYHKGIRQADRITFFWSNDN
jgi:hypothetical protein